MPTMHRVVPHVALAAQAPPIAETVGTSGDSDSFLQRSLLLPRVRPSHLAVREVAAGNAPDAAIGEINFSDVARSVWKFADDAVDLKGMFYLHARSETSFVHDSLREFAVVFRKLNRRGQNVALIDECQRERGKRRTPAVPRCLSRQATC